MNGFLQKLFTLLNDLFFLFPSLYTGRNEQAVVWDEPARRNQRQSGFCQLG